ncbi:MAG TPA: hypothetical protein PKC68_03675 [Alphaproteobacteria bacterium]|jgi:hypothetical protein|nr:hypothetical protein [Alphaproteobacteria bacterium]HMS44871.1 hypothetical protein [Alphaproteobacteria bacterium]
MRIIGALVAFITAIVGTVKGLIWFIEYMFEGFPAIHHSVLVLYGACLVSVYLAIKTLGESAKTFATLLLVVSGGAAAYLYFGMAVSYGISYLLLIIAISALIALLGSFQESNY